MIIAIIAVAAFFLYSAQRYLYRKIWNKNLDVEIQFSTGYMTEGETGVLSEVITNNKFLPLPVLKVKFQCTKYLKFTDCLETSVTDLYYRNDIFCIMPYQKVTRKLEFIGTKRGYYSIKGIDLVGNDLFLSTETNQSNAMDKNIYVYPKRIHQKEILSVLMQMNGEMEVKKNFLEDPFIYRGIREYQSSDGMKSINWKATARIGELKVNQKGHTSRNSVKIFLNLEDNGILKKENQVENTIRLAATFAGEFLKIGRRVALYSNGVDIETERALCLKSNSGAVHLAAVNQCLARIDTSKNTKNTKECFYQELFSKETGYMALFLSPNTYPNFQRLVQEYADTGGLFYWIYITEKREETQMENQLKNRFIQMIIDQEE